MRFVPGADAGSHVGHLPRWGSRLGVGLGSTGLSLRTKALLAFAAFVLYLAGARFWSSSSVTACATRLAS